MPERAYGLGSEPEFASANNRPCVIALMGPTASGKTDLAVRLAQTLDGEVVSVDSALIYRGLDIGAAKPSLEERKGVKHWMMDICDPANPFSVAEFRNQAVTCIRDISSRGKVPVLVGGTMLYFKAVIEGLSDLPETNQRIRDEIEQKAARLGWPAIHSELALVDPVSAERIHPNHSQRLSRALEVFLNSGKPMSKWQVGFQGGLKDEFRWVQLALNPSDRSVLHRRIALRFEHMLNTGLIEEVETLRDRGDLSTDLPAIRAVGYRQVWDYLDGLYNKDVLIEKGIAATRQLAKRQLTWLRSWRGLEWVDTLQSCEKNTKKLKDIEPLLKECLRFCQKNTL